MDGPFCTHWWDGGSTSGPIASSWNVEGWPTLYILDHKGVIRHKFLGFPGEAKFNGALEVLLKEAQKEAEALSQRMTIWLLVYSGKLRSLIQAYYYFVRSVQCRLIWPILVPVHPVSDLVFPD